MEFIATLTLLEENVILSKLTENEICLACLRTTNLKSELFQVNKDNDYYFMITSRRNLFFSTNIDKNHVIDVTGDSLKLKEKMGKDSVLSEQFSFDTEFFNDSLFAELQTLYNQTPEKKLEHYIDILFNKYNSKSAHLEFLIHLYNAQVTEADKLRRTLKSKLVFQFPKKKCSKKLEVDEVFMNLMYSETEFGNTLCEIFKDWSVTPEAQYHFLELLTHDIDNFKLKNIDAFYNTAISGLINLKKQPKDILKRRIKHLYYLKDTQQYEYAIPFYEFVLNSLEDDSILELISDTKTNVLQGEDCHPLRIQLLEDLSEIKFKLNLSNKNELLELARLQPLVLDRLTHLATSGVSTERANTVLSLFMNDAFCDLKINKPNLDYKKTYNKEVLFNLVVPDSFKEAKSFLDSFTNLIAQVSPPEYNQVIAFSEKLTAYNYPETYAVLGMLTKRLQMEEVECYIGNGDFSKGIIGVEGFPNFIILGKDHLQQNHPNYFNSNELIFNLGLELTHILFKHTRITSKDVWRGAKNKGIDLAGILLIALPILSSIGNFAGKFVDMTKYTKLFTSVDSVTNAVDRGQSVIEYGDKIAEKFASKQKESELLATSRLMEISADRVGLLLNDDLKSCVSVLLKNIIVR